MTQQKLPAKTKLTVTLGVMGRLLKKVPRIAFFMLAFYAIFWVGTQLYYRFAPSENFLNYYYAKVDDTPVGTEPLMTLCRSGGATTSVVHSSDRSSVHCSRGQFEA